MKTSLPLILLLLLISPSIFVTSFCLLTGKKGTEAPMYDIYELISYAPSIGPANFIGDNSNEIKISFSTMPGLLGAQEITIGTWVKFDTRTSTDVEPINLYFLWSETNGNWLHKFQRVSSDCVSSHQFGNQSYSETYTTYTSSCSISRGYWYQTVSTMNYTAFSSEIVFYDPAYTDNYSAKAYISWTSPTTAQQITFQSTDYISFRHADPTEYPATDAIFTGAFVVPHYLPDDPLTFAFGILEANYLVVYQFSSTTAVQDYSGYGYDGTLNQSLSAPYNFSPYTQVVLPSTISAGMQTETQVIGLSFNQITFTNDLSTFLLFTIYDGSTPFLSVVCYNYYPIFQMWINSNLIASFDYDTEYSFNLIFRAYSSRIDLNLYVLPDNITYYQSVPSPSYPTSWVISIGGCNPTYGGCGFTGTFKDFRIFTGTGAIPGMNHMSVKYCNNSVGTFAGTHDPCFLDYPSLGPVACGLLTTGMCIACDQNFLMLNLASDPPSCQTGCPSGYAGVCNSCINKGQLYYGGSCVGSCPSDYAPDYSHGICVNCAANGSLLYNNTCISICPTGYSRNAFGVCSLCSNSQYYFNRSCVDSCPSTTFPTGLFECAPCALGCDSCTFSSNNSCTKCSSGFYSLNGVCVSGCPPGMYTNSQTRTCDGCSSACLACNSLSNSECTSCSTGFLLCDGQCVQNCPPTYYSSYFGDQSVYQIPACIPRLGLVFNLTLRSQPRIVYISFNYSIAEIIFAVTQYIQITIANTQIGAQFYSLNLVSNSTIEFQYLGNQYFPSLSILNVTICLNSSFSYDPYQKFMLVNQTATIQLSEIYPFTQSQMNTITGSANAVSGTGRFIAGGQAFASVAESALSLSFVRMQILGELIQLLRFVPLDWPPNVKEFFASTHYDPNSIVIQFDVTQSWNNNLNNRNTSMPFVYQAYEVTPFFTENFNNELSNIFVLLLITVFGTILTYVLQKKLPLLEEKLKFLKSRGEKIMVTVKPPKKPREEKKLVKRCSECLLPLIDRLKAFFEKTNFKVLWNFALMFYLSLFQSGMFWSLVNFKYATNILEPATYYTRGSLAIGAITFISNLCLLVFVLFAIQRNFKHVLKAPDFSKLPEYIEPYKVLFEDFDNKTKLQLLFTPIEMIRSFIYTLIIVVFPNTAAQMTLIWLLSLSFIIYMIICQPLRKKFMSRITLSVELFAFACLTIGFVLAIVETNSVIDVDARNDIGLAFLSFALLMTIAGGILTLIQVLGIIISIYKFFKIALKKKVEVYPITLPDLPQVESPGTIISIEKLKPIATQNCTEADLHDLQSMSKASLCTDENKIKIEQN